MTREEAIKILMGHSHTPQERVALEVLIPELRESEDERMRKAALEGIEYLERKLGWDFIGDTDILDVKEYLEKQKEQKPAEWSEVDRHNLNSVISLVHGTTDGAWGSCIGDRIETWLKSLPERFNLQPKQERSEEDDEELSNWRDAVANYGHEVAPCQRLIDWLKSLKKY